MSIGVLKSITFCSNNFNRFRGIRRHVVQNNGFRSEKLSKMTYDLHNCLDYSSKKSVISPYAISAAPEMI